MQQIPAEVILTEQSVRAGVAALEQLHGRHLGDMSPDEQEQARAHWRDQVERILHAVHGVHTSTPQDGGRALILLADGPGDQVEISVEFKPDLREISAEEVEGTPAQVLAIAALEAIQAETEEGPER